MRMRHAGSRRYNPVTMRVLVFLHLSAAAFWVGGMAFTVVVEPYEKFKAWYDSQLAPSAQPSTPSQARGQQVFLSSPCVMCHTVTAKYALGVNTAQMNKDHDYGGVVANQLSTLEHLGIFDRKLPKPVDQLDKLVDPRDEKADLDARARSYLQANCSHCHRKWGGGNAEFQLLYTLPIKDTGTIGVKPGQGRSVLAVHSRTSPQRKPRRPATCAASSHSTSVGSRRPAQRAHASASHHVTCIAAWLPAMRADLPNSICITAPLAEPICSTWRGPRRPSRPDSRCSHCQPCGCQCAALS